MSNFDENPFAAPFSDPSVQRAVASSAAANASLEDYNPFDPKQAQTKSGGDAPAVMKPTQDAPPPYSATGQQQITSADFQKRQEELERRARELERREEELRNAPYNVRANNFPPLPKFCPVQPCFYQDINVDIPVEFQKVVRYLYYLWIVHASLLFANMAVGLLYLFAGGDMGQTFGLALVYWFLFTPASFLCWYRPAYKAFRDDSSVNFMVFFFVFFFQMLVSILNTLGIGGMGACGLITSIAMMSQDTGGKIFVGVLMLLVGLGFAAAALADFYMLVKIHRMYRSTGASFAKAQAEFTTGVMRNEQVQQAAAAAARETVRQTFTQAAQPGQPGQNAPRY